MENRTPISHLAEAVQQKYKLNSMMREGCQYHEIVALAFEGFALSMNKRTSYDLVDQER